MRKIFFWDFESSGFVGELNTGEAVGEDNNFAKKKEKRVFFFFFNKKDRRYD